MNNIAISLLCITTFALGDESGSQPSAPWQGLRVLLIGFVAVGCSDGCETLRLALQVIMRRLDY